jgi:putative redox protein
MTKKATVTWLEGYRLEGLTDNGKIVMMDTGEKSTAASPAQLLLQSLAGCTMMDCVLVIAKSRKSLEKFWVDIEAEEAHTHPKVYTKIHLTYNFIGKDLDAATVERAIKLSEETYCRIHAMLSPVVQLTSSYNLNKAN